MSGPPSDDLETDLAGATGLLGDPEQAGGRPRYADLQRTTGLEPSAASLDALRAERGAPS